MSTASKKTSESNSPVSSPKLNTAGQGKNILNDMDIIQCDDGYVFNPYNHENREITLNEVQSILSSYGIPTQLNNFELYRRAFIHASYTKRPQLENARENIKIMPQPVNCMPLKTKSNERLEFLGDGVLECVTKYYLYRRFPKENEGFMTEKKNSNRKKRVNRKTGL